MDMNQTIEKTLRDEVDLLKKLMRLKPNMTNKIYESFAKEIGFLESMDMDPYMFIKQVRYLVENFDQIAFEKKFGKIL